ncbi:uncharacterized protein BDZ99DRAFT_513627 [Mytilinidion resinicola]|uniref:Uncharacterized protein n=1 Tax=Mytilinidion resinicola TaxID=574789 RepID=A0A6A6Z8Q1_9PEZI|nr:uncharacterized protein BDZ99DRAFT_513627 [Mytilinidion resinicola]KAF2817386.1 hypothetical protein BDZ99DRAFT_513627 [Mytilinidion resinicola]
MADHSSPRFAGSKDLAVKLDFYQNIESTMQDEPNTELDYEPDGSNIPQAMAYKFQSAGPQSVDWTTRESLPAGSEPPIEALLEDFDWSIKFQEVSEIMSLVEGTDMEDSGSSMHEDTSQLAGDKSKKTYDKFKDAPVGSIIVYLAYMIHTFRNVSDGLIDTNSILKGMQIAMRLGPQAGHPRDKWTRAKQADEVPSTWNEKNVSTAGYQPRYRTHPNRKTTSITTGLMRLVDPMPFKDLANGVKELPQGEDCGDLTCCVSYHLRHPNEDWTYPTDFAKLVNHIGGLMHISNHHTDHEAFSRWEAAMKSSMELDKEVN